MSEIYAKETIDINEVSARINTKYSKNSNDGVRCYNCYEIGHLKRDCLNPKKEKNTLNENKNRSKDGNSTTDNNNNTIKTNSIKINKISQSRHITGNCLVDGNQGTFMADTGAEMTIIDVNLLTLEQQNEIKPTWFDVMLADKSKATVLGQKMCTINVGNKNIELNVLVTKDLSEQCLLGIDFLRMHPQTKSLIVELEHVLMGNVEKINDGNKATIRSVATLKKV